MTTRVPFNAQDFLALAEQLANDPVGDEAKYRSALSRAYYALFLHARESLIARGVMAASFSGTDHGLVIQTLRALSQGNADQLGKLRNKRNRADYDLRIHVGASEAKQAVVSARALWPRL
jgi:uncharacterized protein (UPF0332 family)